MPKNDNEDRLVWAVDTQFAFHRLCEDKNRLSGLLSDGEEDFCWCLELVKEVLHALSARVGKLLNDTTAKMEPLVPPQWQFYILDMGDPTHNQRCWTLERLVLGDIIHSEKEDKEH